jgi:NAD(P)-dependent dehydrogenase (short-subunit alcohol dehydrogenase family)
MQRFAFAGRTCLITGAAGGIGAALALDLARRRADLALLDKDAEGLARVAEVAREVGAASVTTYVIDLGDGATGSTWPPRSPPGTAGWIF